jgi:hypothetical protein
MKAPPLAKKMCALLLVFSTFGIALGTSTPADAQTPPEFVTWWQRNRTVELTSDFATCTRNVPSATNIRVPRGEWRFLQQAWFSCGNGVKTIVATLHTFAGFEPGGLTTAAYVLNVRVDDASGSTQCDSHWEQSNISETINETITLFWVGPLQSSENPVDRLIYADCGPHGTIGYYYQFDEGLGTF